MDRQITVPGDWQAKRPHVPPGGWAFQYDNDGLVTGAGSLTVTRNSQNGLISGPHLA